MISLDQHMVSDNAVEHLAPRGHRTYVPVLFAAKPSIIKDDYAKWMLDDPGEFTEIRIILPRTAVRQQ